MPSASSARLKGDDFQHLYTWHRVLALRKHGKRVERVSIEVPSVGALDDVVIHSTDAEGAFGEFCQVKFHVDQRSHYSTDLLLKAQNGERSLLQKLYDGWQNVARACERHEVVLVTTWSWDASDPFARAIDGETARIKEEFLTASRRTALGNVRQRWICHLDADPSEFEAFIRVLRLDFGYSATQKLKDDVSERMASIGLRWDDDALACAVTQVRDWIKSGQIDVDDAELETAIERYDLRAAEPELFAVIHLHTIVKRAFSDPADYELDWVDLFPGSPDKGHLPLDPQAWNNLMLPELRRLRTQIDATPAVQLLRWRGQARLSPWLAAGFVFREVAGYALEAQQGPYLWRTDAPLAPDFELASPDIRDLGPGSRVAVGISVTNDLTEDVLDYLRDQGQEFGAVMFLRPARPLGRTSLRGAGDAAALAQLVKAKIQRFVRRQSAEHLGLFYLGPLSGALFIGHQLNACAPEIQVFEDAAPGYAPSFLLHE